MGDFQRGQVLSPTPWRVGNVPRSPSLSPSPPFEVQDMEHIEGLEVSFQFEKCEEDEAMLSSVASLSSHVWSIDMPETKTLNDLSIPILLPLTHPSPLLGSSSPINDEDIDFLCVVSAELPPPQADLVPVLLLSEEERSIWYHRRQSAPARLLSTRPHNMATGDIAHTRRASKDSDDVNHRYSRLPSHIWDDENKRTSGNNWLGLRRALSVGSDRRTKRKGFHDTTNNNNSSNDAHGPHRRLSSVLEIEQPQPEDMLTLAYRARQMRSKSISSSLPRSSTSFPGPIRHHQDNFHHHHQRSLSKSHSPTAPGISPPGPVPSGPSSPSSPSPSHRDFSLVDGDLFALNFPRPPGRVVSGFSDMDPLLPPMLIDYYHKQELQKKSQSDTTKRRPSLPSPSPVNEDYPCDVASTARTHTFCPPSPTLTPSPHLSLDDSPILTTPGYPEINPKDSVRICVSGQSPSPPLSSQNHPSQGTPFIPLSSRGSSVSKTKDNKVEAATITKTLSPSTLIVSEKEQKAFMSGYGHSRTEPEASEGWYSDTDEPVNPRPPTSLDPSHPFHHKSNPSVPFSTRTTSTLSRQGPESDHPQPSCISPPPSYVQLNPSAPNSRRHSRFTAFSGTSSSSSSVYSASDTSSIRHNGRDHHWGFGEKPDISTVFEEDPVEADVGVDVKFSGDKAGSASIPASQRKGKVPINLPPQTAPPKGPAPRPSPLLSPSDIPPANTYRYPNLNTASSLSSSSTLVNGRSVSAGRPHRSATISSQVSAGSNKSTRSQHPFASAVIRPSSPPPPLPSQSSGGRSTISMSKSQPNLINAFRDPPMSSQPAHQVRVASAAEPEEDMCPVCVEPLSSNYRLEGERPHVFPECGHGLHHDCFTHVYGEVPRPGSTRNIGVCGICRQNMRITEGGPGPSRKKRGNKFAALAGQQPSPSFLGSSAASVTSGHGSLPSPPSPTSQDMNGDDPLVLATNKGMSVSTSSKSINKADASRDVVVPTITIKSEFSSISRTKPQNKAQLLTAMVTVVVPPAPERGTYPAKPRLMADEDAFSPQLPPSPRSAGSFSEASPAPTSARSVIMTPSGSNSPFAHVISDLRKRVPNYNNSGLDSLGPLRLFDILAVRKGSLSKDFSVYLFQDALICIQEEKRGGFRNLFSSGSSSRSNESSKHKNTELALKGRIFLKHVSHVTDTSVPGELTLTIVMVDEGMDAFVLLFKDRGSHETWKHNLNMIVAEARQSMPHHVPQLFPTMPTMTSSTKIAQMMGTSVPATFPRSASVAGSSTFSPTSAQSPSAFSFGEALSAGRRRSLASKESTLGDLVHIAPLAPVHTPIDVVVILSLPGPNNTGESTPLKTRLMRQSLQFMLALMGSRDRVSFVSCEMGQNGTIRKTPFLNPTKYQSRRRLETFVEMLGSGHNQEDEFEVQVQADEKLDVVTAMNVALDVVLQRTVKNPIGSMILISDTSDSIKRAQMELVTARLDAANLPVHSFGYGRGHDPSPLWMISNHTHGTYTFVKEWYNLKDTLAGLLAGLMNVAVTNMKLHLNCEENDFKILKVAGSNQAIIAKSGKTVEIDLRELRFGEKREILFDLDIETPGAQDASDNRYSGVADSLSPSAQPLSASSSQGSIGRSPSIGRSAGLESVSSSASSPFKKIYEGALIDECPVTEVDCSWHDPDVGLNVHRLNHPVLLTVALLPPNAPPSSNTPDYTVVRRRLEVLASDMITRALLIASRQNYAQALKLLTETKKVIEGTRNSLERQVTPGSSLSSVMSSSRSRREQQIIGAIRAMGYVIADLDYLVEGLEEQKDMFERDHRNFAAQQAVVYRDQRSWTTYTESEAHYATPEVQQFLKLSARWRPDL